MTNKERQSIIDEEILVESEKNNTDMKGFMPYCEYCENENACESGEYSYSDIMKKSLCAKAYNKMKRSK